MCMNPIVRFFKTIDHGLSTCVDYFDYRIRTGKFIDDIRYYIAIATDFLSEKGKKFYTVLIKSQSFFSLINFLKTLWQTLINIPLIGVILYFIADTIKILILCYSEIFIVFA